MAEPRNTTRTGRIIRAADLGGTFVFAIEGAMVAQAAGFDPVGILVLAFLTALGGGIIRDTLIGALPPAAIREWRYAVIVLAASVLAFTANPAARTVPDWLMTGLDAAGLALFAVAGTEKSLQHGVHPLPAIFLGTIGGVGGGVMRDLMLSHVPRILNSDIYATAAMLGASIVVLGQAARIRPQIMAVVAALACFALRMVAVARDWQLPREL